MLQEPMSSRRSLITISLITLLFPTLLLAPPPAMAATGSLYISPAKLPLSAPGSTISFSVKIANMNPFNAWDIMVWSNQSFLSPQSISISPNTFDNYSSSSYNQLVNCVNGGVGLASNTPGNIGCTIDDAPGIAHSAVVYLGSAPQMGLTSGLLFNVTYRAVAPPGTNVHIFNDVIADAGSAVPHMSIDGIYGNPSPDFLMTTHPTSFSVLGGDSVPVTVTLASLGSFTGSINLQAAPSGLTTPFSPTTLKLTPGITNTSTLTIITTTSTPAQTYLVDLTASNGTIIHKAELTIAVKAAAPIIKIKTLSASSKLAGETLTAHVGETILIDTTVVNNGTISGTFVLQIIWNNYVAVQKNVTIPAGQGDSLSLPWNTVGYPGGTSNITARVSDGDTLLGPIITLTVPYSVFNDPIFWTGLLAAIVVIGALILWQRPKTVKRRR